MPAPSPNPDPLHGLHVFVGVTGGIAAYKTAMLVSRLAQAAAVVYTSAWEHIESSDPQHISLAKATQVAIVAPCTMDCMAKLAHGRTDDVVALILSAIDRTRTSVILAPAMNAAMWHQPSTQRNLRTLIADGFTIVGPDDGWQACRSVGPGRMSEPDALLEAIRKCV